MNDPVGVGPIGNFGRMTAAPRIYGTPVTGLGSIDKSVTVRPFFFFESRLTLRWQRYTPAKQANSRNVRSDTLFSFHSPKFVV